MDTFWIVSADETRGRIFRSDTLTGNIQEFEDLVHPEARATEADLARHTRGSHASTQSIKGHSLNESGTLKEHHADIFAKELADRLIDGDHKNMFSNLIIVAPPKFLGMLRKKLNTSTGDKVRFELNKDLSKLDTSELRAHLPTILPRQ